MKGLYLYSFLVIALSLICSSSAQQSCTNITQDTVRDQVNSERPTGDGSPNNVNILSWYLLCISTAGTIDRYRTASFVTRYEVTSGGDVERAQVDVTCSDTNSWSNVGGSFSLLNMDEYNERMNASLRTDCSRCLLAVSGSGDLHHCEACDSECDKGLGYCGFGGTCCSYFQGSSCTTECNSNSSPNSVNICTCNSIFRTEADDCATCSINATDCINGGMANTTSCQCQCADGYTGPTCANDVDECTELSPCQNGGSCINTNGSYTCNCLNGYTGDNCEDDIDECAQGSSPCQNGGSCNNTFGGYTCSCLSEFSGNDCQEDVNECTATNPCQNGATCNNFFGGYNCTCDPSFTGNNCALTICEVPDFCQNGGTCMMNTSSNIYRCHCSPGYTGLDCTTDINECDIPDTCYNGGTCVNNVGSFSCRCQGSWSGQRCDYCEPIADCIEQTCSEPTVRCLRCSVGFSLVNRLCVSCNVKDCLSCVTKDVCSTCNTTYSLDDRGEGICEPPPERVPINTPAIIGIVIALVVFLMSIVVVILVVIIILAKINSKKPPTYNVNTPKPDDKDIILTKQSKL